MGWGALEAGLMAPIGKECCIDPISLLTAPPTLAVPRDPSPLHYAK